MGNLLSRLLVPHVFTSCRGASSCQLQEYLELFSPSMPIVSISAGFASPSTFTKRISPAALLAWTHRSATATWRTLPSPSRFSIPMAALASEQPIKPAVMPKAASRDLTPSASVEPLTMAANSASPVDSATIISVLPDVFRVPEPQVTAPPLFELRVKCILRRRSRRRP
jgi:hypothetical protein